VRLVPTRLYRRDDDGLRVRRPDNRRSCWSHSVLDQAWAPI
jgi:hypothetical protein